MRLFIPFLAAACAAIPVSATPPDPLPDGIARTLVLAPGEGNPRNSEGDFIQLADGRILFVYTHFTGGGGDHDRALLASRTSRDGGATWTEDDETVITGEGGMNVMSVSLLRLRSGAIALFYLRKDSREQCMPRMRLSHDEAATWGPPRDCLRGHPGYYVVNNDRVVQLESGRLLMPSALHAVPGGEGWFPGRAIVWRSDDEGATWQAGNTLEAPEPIGASGLQEPGLVSLKDGRTLMLLRTDAGCQYRSISGDGGETWSAPEPTGLSSPVSPATIERIPSTGDLLLLWNDHRAVPLAERKNRTPLTAAISRDDGATWDRVKNIESHPHGWYCYTAVDFVDEHVLLGLCAGNRQENNGLALTQVLRVPVDWLYAGGESFSGAATP
jgi:hypothetical protein